MKQFGWRLAIVIGIGLALIPLLIYLYLGQFARLMHDDYGAFGMASLVGTWDAMLFWREIWTGKYTSSLLLGSLAPFATDMPAIFPIVMSVLSFFGFAWLIRKSLAHLGIRQHRCVAALSLASLAAAATFNGFITWELCYWLTAVVTYALPGALLMLGLALALQAGAQLHSARRLWLAASALAMAAFLNAGFSEMFMVFQIVFIALLAAYACLYIRGGLRRVYLALALAGGLGSVASFVVQATAPGLAFRASLPVNFGHIMTPMRDPGNLLGNSLELALAYLGHESAFAGFMLLAAAGLLVTLKLYEPESGALPSKRPALETSGLWLCLIAQVCLFPYLFSHTSDDPLLFGRFSARYAPVVGINLLLILVPLALILKRSQFSAALRRRDGLMRYCGIVLLAVLVLFSLSQVTEKHQKVSAYLVISAFTLLVLLSRQLASAVDAPRVNRLGRASELTMASGVICLAALVGVSLWGQGHVYERTLGPISFLLMASGLFWGLHAGALLKRCRAVSYLGATAIRWIGAGSLLVALIIGGGVALGQLRLLDDFAASAKLWDETHQEILALAAEGSPKLDTEEFPYLVISPGNNKPGRYRYGKLHWFARLFYGLDYEPQF